MFCRNYLQFNRQFCSALPFCSACSRTLHQQLRTCNGHKAAACCAVCYFTCYFTSSLWYTHPKTVTHPCTIRLTETFTVTFEHTHFYLLVFFCFTLFSCWFCVRSVLWRCWFGDRKGIRPVKTEWWGTGVVICLERGADLHMAQLMPLPLTVSCFSKIQIG